MSIRLRTRHECPPNGFLYTQQQTGWQSWIAAPGSQYNFDELCRALQQHRLANPQFQLPTDLPSIEAEVDTVNALRCLGFQGGDYYVADGGVDPVPKSPTLHSLTLKLQGAVEGVKRVSAGGAVLFDWEASGEPPVASEQSTQRAWLCGVRENGSGCPKNGKGDFTRWFTVPASEEIRKHLSRLHELKLSTPHDDKINVCEACLCPLKLKVHTPLKFILPHTSDEVKAELDSRCWMIHEALPANDNPVGS